MERRRRRVLVVDDDRDIRDILAYILGDEGFEVREAANGCDALAVLAAWRTDLILLDITMPIMDGPAFLARQQATPELARIPVIVMTARTSPKVDTSGGSVAAVIAKPFDVDDLQTKVSEQIRRASPAEQPIATG